MDCSEIIPGRLWVGAYIRPYDVGLLDAMGITVVVSLQSPEDLAYCGISEGKVSGALAASEIDFRRAPVRDFDQKALQERLPDCVSQVQDALSPTGARVYLHCTAGINRAPTVAAALLMRTRGLSAQQAFDYVSTRRHCSPYLAVLESFEPSAVPPNHPGS